LASLRVITQQVDKGAKSKPKRERYARRLKKQDEEPVFASSLFGELFCLSQN